MALKPSPNKRKKAADVGVPQPEGTQYHFTDEEKRRFRDDPEHHLAYRKNLEAFVNDLFDMFVDGSETSKGTKETMIKEMHRRIGPGHEELKEKLIPSWPPGCRRITPGDGYLEALVAPSEPLRALKTVRGS